MSLIDQAKQLVDEAIKSEERPRSFLIGYRDWATLVEAKENDALQIPAKAEEHPTLLGLPIEVHGGRALGIQLSTREHPIRWTPKSHARL